METGTFDLTFDDTFGGLVFQSAPVASVGCRKPGVFLSWLSPFGPAYWLFEGFADRERQVTTLGTVKRGGLVSDVRKESNQVITARAVLTEQESELVATIFESVAIYALVPTKDETLVQVPCRVEPVTAPEWKEAETRLYLDVKVIFPGRKSARA